MTAEQLKPFETLLVTYQTRLAEAEHDYQTACKRLARDFAHEGGPPWASTSDEAGWRTLRERAQTLRDVCEDLACRLEIARGLP